METEGAMGTILPITQTEETQAALPMGAAEIIMRAEPEERQETVRTAIRTVLQEESVLNSPS